MSTQLELAAPVNPMFIKDPPQGKHGKYIGHSDIAQIALAIAGPHSFDVLEVVRGHIPEWSNDYGKSNPERTHGIVAALCRMQAVIDGVKVSVTEVGVSNSPEVHSDGENLKTAASDGYKRCWMRQGLGLHMWVDTGKDNASPYKLDAALRQRDHHVEHNSLITTGEEE
jgi:hypothetical protein